MPKLYSSYLFSLDKLVKRIKISYFYCNFKPSSLANNAHSFYKITLSELKNINVVFEQKKALQNINLTLYPNSIITIVGPNGGGKSTLLKVLLKLLPSTSGQVIYHKNLRIGYVPQKIHLDHSLPITVERFFITQKKGIFSPKLSKTLC
ncbi:YebM, partial [Pasteurella multocida subsp. multocida str. Anand1_cattle]